MSPTSFFVYPWIGDEIISDEQCDKWEGWKIQKKRFLLSVYAEQKKLHHPLLILQDIQKMRCFAFLIGFNVSILFSLN